MLVNLHNSARTLWLREDGNGWQLLYKSTNYWSATLPDNTANF